MTPSRSDATARLSVVVPLYNGRELVLGCLASIPPGVEVVVSDDASTDGAADLVARHHPDAVLLRADRNVGFGANANRGLRRATRPIRVVLNTDARLRPGAVEALVAAFDDPKVGVAGPRLVFPDGSHQTSAASFPSVANSLSGSFLLNDLFRAVLPGRRFPFELGMARRDHDHSHDVDWVMGVCIALRDECFRDTGGFDEGYFMYVEETDLCLRAARAGWHVRYVADAVVEHVGGGSTGDPAVHARRFLDSERRFMARCHGPEVIRAWRAARVGGSVGKLVALTVPAVLSRRARMRWRWHYAAARHLASRGRRASPSAPG